MIAVVTSTLSPLIKDGRINFYTFAERLEQTKLTLNSLNKLGFDSIFLIDNSSDLSLPALQKLFVGYPQIKIYHIQQYQFKNKGINELLMLLYLVQFLPLDQAIFKISGRYALTELFQKISFADFAVKGYSYHKLTGTISTRAYWVSNKEIFKFYLEECLREIFNYPERIAGVRSFYNKIKTVVFKKHLQPINISIEFAFANVLKKYNCKLQLLDYIRIEGFVAGTDKIEKIIE